MLLSLLRKKKETFPENSFCGFNSLKSSHLYEHVKAYLSSEEYWFLMNTNKLLFRDIKMETMIFTLNISRDTSKLEIKPFDQVVKTVHNPKRQIALNMDYFGANEKKYLARWSNLYKLSIYHDTATNDFDFSLFNNIPVVSLKGFKGVKKITKGLQNIQDLTISMETLEAIYNMNVTGSLTKLCYLHCNALVEFPIRKDQSEILYRVMNSPFREKSRKILFENQVTTTFISFQILEIDLSTSFDGIESTENAPLEEISVESPARNSFSSDQFVESDNQYLFYHVTELELTSSFLGMDAISSTSILLSIKDLNLNSIDTACFPSAFYGIKLSLTKFDLSSWTTSSSVDVDFPNLKYLSLHSCSNLISFPSMIRNLQSLSLIRMNHLLMIPTISSLRSLSLDSLSKLKEISKQPQLKYLLLSNCPMVQDLSFLEGQIMWKIVIDHCGNIQDLSPCRNCYQLKIDFLRSLSHLPPSLTLIPDQDLLFSQRHRRRWKIEGPFHTSLSSESIQFEDISELELAVFPNIIQFHHIRNISRLTISRMKELTTTTGLFDINESFVLASCEKLVSLVGLQHIPEIAFFSLPKVTDISGLGHHEHLFLHDVPFLEAAARQYAADKKKGSEQSNRFHDIFSTIQAVSIIPRYNIIRNMSFPLLKDEATDRLW